MHAACPLHACAGKAFPTHRKEHMKRTLSWSAGIAGCAKPGPAIVRGTLKVFFLLLVSFLVTTAGLAAVSLAPLLLPAPFSATSSAAACEDSSNLTKQFMRNAYDVIWQYVGDSVVTLLIKEAGR